MVIKSYKPNLCRNMPNIIRPLFCECPTFVCPCIALIYNRTVGRWYCAYCTSRSYTILNRCCLCHLPGRCVDKDTGEWYCNDHGHQCDVLVPRPEGCGWPARNLPCSQLAQLLSSNGRYMCHDHLEEMIAGEGNVNLRPLHPQANIDHLLLDAPPTPLDHEGELVDLDAFSTLVERDCPICLEPKFKWRRLTTCGHELCEECLQRQLRSSIHNRLLCPFDRRSLFD